MNPREFMQANERDRRGPTPCTHDYVDPVRQGRAHYTCAKCGADITMGVVLLHEAERGEG